MVGALVSGHQRFAEHAGAEVRDDDRDVRKSRRHRGERERIAEPQIERRRQTELLANADRQHAAVYEHTPPWCCDADAKTSRTRSSSSR